MKYLLLLLLAAGCYQPQITQPIFSIEKREDMVYIDYRTNHPTDWQILIGPTIEYVLSGENKYVSFQSTDTGCDRLAISYKWYTQYFRLTNSDGVDIILDTGGKEH